MQQVCLQATKPLVFVPTMGALHEGHASLLRHARKLAGASGTVAVSIFLNPKQFDVAKDLEVYPKPFEADKAVCQKEGVTLLFHPKVEEMYPSASSIHVVERELSASLCGALRPGHFDGVAMVLTKLFHIVMPTHAIFGEKDWQQLSIVRRLVRELNFPIEIIAHPTVREHDGLARSSRNERLSSKERALAPNIYQALEQTRARVLEGESDVSTLCHFTRKGLTTIPQVTIDYVAIVNEETLQPLEKILPGGTPARLLVAVKMGGTRLIDNIGLPTKSIIRLLSKYADEEV